MKSDIQIFSVLQNRTGQRSFTQLSVVSVMLAFFASWLPLQAEAATVDDQFEFYVYNLCQNPPPGSDLAKLTPFCFAAFPGGTAGSPGTMTSSSNLGATRGGAVSLQPQGIQDRLEERKKEAEKAASADGGGWGLLLSPQYGKSKRPETELENGFQSELNGLLIGLDYRFSDKFVLGAAIGHTKDDADFINNAGFLKTTSNTFSLYGTWALSDYAYIDGYLGAGKLNLDSQRQVNFGLLSPGTASGNTSGQQTMAGLSASYKADLGRVSFEPFVNFDYIKTDVDGYDESGTTSMELRHRDRKNISTTSSVGGRSSMAYGYDWGTLVPSVHLAAVHEYKNDSSQIGNELVIAPGTPFMVDTDAPDRNYLSAGLGMAAALNGGAQLFLNYEKRMKDKLLNCWAVSAGVLVEF